MARQRKMVVLFGACMSGKSHLLKKLKKELKDKDVFVFDTDELEYWSEAIQSKTERDFLKRYDFGDGVRVSKKLEENLMCSSSQEKVVKLKFIKMAECDKDLLVVGVLDRNHYRNQKFFKIFSDEFNIDIIYMCITASFPRFILNIIKRKDKKKYLETWGRRKEILNSQNNFDYCLKNSLYLGTNSAVIIVKSIFCKSS